MRDLVDALGMILQFLVVGEIAMQRVVLLPEVTLPVKFVPGKAAALVPFVFEKTFGVKITHLARAFCPVAQCGCEGMKCN